VVFPGGPEEEGTATRLLMHLYSFEKRPDVRNPRPWVKAALVTGATAIVLRRRRDQRFRA
jgi:hypothetical protein